MRTTCSIYTVFDDDDDNDDDDDDGGNDNDGNRGIGYCSLLHMKNHCVAPITHSWSVLYKQCSEW